MLVDPAMISMLKELRLPGQPDPVAEILQVYEADGRRMLAKLQLAIRNHDARQIHEAAHRLKGSSANLGAVALQARLHELEAITMDGTLPEALDDELDVLGAMFEQSLIALQHLAVP